MKLISSYALSLYGSSSWNLLSKSTEKLFKSWNVCIRQVFRLDRKTHRQLIEPISGAPHLKTVLLCRYRNFHESLLKSQKIELRFLARLNERDNRTVMGSTLSNISLSCGLNFENLTSKNILSNMTVLPHDKEKVLQESMIMELLSWRENKTEIEGFTKEELEEILKYACIS